MKPKKRKYNPRRVRVGQSYSVQDIAELCGIHPNVVLLWRKMGLNTIDGRKPYFFHGYDLRVFLEMKRAKRKCKCRPDEFFCFKCRAPRTVYGGMVDIQIQDASKVKLSGLCAVCGTSVHRAGSVKKLPEYQKTFSTQTMGQSRISGNGDPLVNSDFGKETRT